MIYMTSSSSPLNRFVKAFNKWFNLQRITGCLLLWQGVTLLLSPSAIFTKLTETIGVNIGPVLSSVFIVCGGLMIGPKITLRKYRLLTLPIIVLCGILLWYSATTGTGWIALGFALCVYCILQAKAVEEMNDA